MFHPSYAEGFVRFWSHLAGLFLSPGAKLEINQNVNSVSWQVTERPYLKSQETDPPAKKKREVNLIKQ